jgi:CheY-like chemotaxis protein
VLIADDSRMGLSLLEALFEPYPVEVLRAVDGEEAMRLVLAHEPDLVLSDILMPRLDGFGLTRRIRARDNDPQPVVFLTTALTVRGELKTEARRAGADEVLAKPLTSEAFRVALERHFDLRPPGSQPRETNRSPGRYATQPVGREEILAALRGPDPSTAETHLDHPPAVPPDAPQAPAAPHPRRSSERDVDALLAEALGDLHLER